MTALPESATAVERILAWEGCFNARDVGGLPTNDGGVVRRGALVRSDVLCRLSDAGRQALIDHGVRTIIDVRSAHEIARDWHLYPFRDDADGDTRVDRLARVAYRNVPFSGDRDEHAWQEVRAAYETARTRAELNRIDVDANGDGIAAIVAAVADAPDGGVLVHCHAGKDRTGVVIAMLLALAGVSDDHIADDYAMTALNLEPLIVDWLAEMGGDEAERERLRELARPTREAMLDTLVHVRERHGTIEEYLRRHGVTDEQIGRIRARLVGPPASG